MESGLLNCAEKARDDLRVGAADLDAAHRALAGIGLDSWQGGAADAARADVEELRMCVLAALGDVDTAISAVSIEAEAINAAPGWNIHDFAGLSLAGIETPWWEQA